MDRTLATVAFDHPALAGDAGVSVAQNLGHLPGEDGTARWVWPGATATATWLCDRADEWIRGKRVVELGAGTGLLGLVASRLGAASVVLTDLPSELPLLRHNADADAARSGGACPVEVSACGWGDAAAVAALRPPFDVVLCSDVLYQNDEATQTALARTIRDLLRAPDGSGEARERRPRGRCLMSYHFRENVLADATFFEATEAFFGDPTRHSVGGELDDELWLFEYAPKEEEDGR